MVHVEQPNAQLVEHNVQPVAEAHCLLVGLSEGTHSRVLPREGEGSGLIPSGCGVETRNQAGYCILD